MNEHDSDTDPPRVRQVGEPESIPLYNCLVIISRLDNGTIHGQVSNLEGIEFSAATEREVLQEIVRVFKKEIGKFVEADQKIPWVDPSFPPAADQVERLIPVHL